MNNKVNNLREYSLRIVHQENYSTYVDLLAKDKFSTIHQELFKVNKNLSNVIMCNILKTRAMTYNLRSRKDFVRNCVNTIRYGLYSQISFAPKVWDMALSEIKNVYSLMFNTEIRN